MITTNLNAYLASMKKAEQLILKTADDIRLEAAERFKTRLEHYTPIGRPELWNYPAPKNYVPGTLKASWELEEKRDVITVWNFQPYAERVETGWSTQAPEGMTRRAVLDYPQILADVAKENKL